MNDSNIKTDWLVNNAVVAFLAAILLTQTPQSTDGRNELIFGFSVPGTPLLWTSSSVAILIAISLICVFASVIPAWREWIVRKATPLVPILEFLTWAGFTAGFAQSTQDLPKDQWWFIPLIYGGFSFMVFLFFRFVFNLVKMAYDRWASARDTNRRNA